MIILKHVDQGTIYYGFRSEKYPEVPCYSVIISARCDIANEKISKLYYLTAVDAHEWFCTANGFFCAFDSHIASCRQNLKEKVESYGINTEVLEKFDEQNAKIVLTSHLQGKDLQKALVEYDSLYSLIRPDMDYNARKIMLRDFDQKKKKNIISNFLYDISSGRKNHYHFIPRLAYSDTIEKTKGLIVDLQEIGILSLDEAKLIDSPGIDYQALLSNPRIKRKSKEFSERFWLETEEDYVYKEGQLQSPWCELLLQRFAMDFIRVGVDGASKPDFENLASNVGKEK